MDTWYFELIGVNRNEWVWTRVDPNGRLIAESKESFEYYLQALDNARAHGLVGRPVLGTPPQEVARTG